MKIERNLNGKELDWKKFVVGVGNYLRWKILKIWIVCGKNNGFEGFELDN